MLLGLGFAGALGANISFASWLPTYYQEQFAFSLERAGQTASVLTIFGMVGSLLGSVLPMRFPRRKPFLLLAGLLMPIAGVGCFLGTSNAVLLPSLAVFGVATSIFIPVMMTIPMEAARIGPARAGVAVSVILGAGNFSGFVVPLLVGTARDVSGTFVLGLAVVAHRKRTGACRIARRASAHHHPHNRRRTDHCYEQRQRQMPADDCCDARRDRHRGRHAKCLRDDAKTVYRCEFARLEPAHHHRGQRTEQHRRAEREEDAKHE